MKKKIFKVWIKQSFNAIKYNSSGKWYKPSNKVTFIDNVENYKHIILATDLYEAIEKYKERYNWNIKDKCIDVLYGALGYYPIVDENNPNYHCEVIGTETKDISFSELKTEMIAEDFMEYCRQELYPTEILDNNE